MNIEVPEVEEGKKEMLSDRTRIFQRKWDGTACYVRVDSCGNITLYGRNLLKSGERMDFTHRFPEVLGCLKALGIPPCTSFIGELIVMNQQINLEDFQLLQPRITRDEDIEAFSKSNPAILLIYEVVKVNGEDVTGLTYHKRMAKLLDVFYKAEIGRYLGTIDFVENTTDGEKLWKEKGLEGVIIRDPLAPFGTGLWKLKHSTTQDVYCKSEYERPELSLKKGQELPTPSRLMLMKYTHNGETKQGVFANLRCYQIVNGKETFIGNIGGGFDDEAHKQVQAILDNKQTFCLEIEAMGITNSGKFRMPRFKRLRPDKSPSQCVRK